MLISLRKKGKKSTHLISGGRKSDFFQNEFTSLLREVGAGCWEEAASALFSPWLLKN